MNIWVDKINNLVTGERGFPEGQDPTLDPEIPFELPSEFIELSRVFGSGEFYGAFDCFSLYNPFAENYWRKVTEDIKVTLEFCEECEYDKLHFWPSENGVLPFGSDARGGYFAWNVSGSPETWKVVYIDRDFDEEEFGPFYSDFTTGEYFFRLLIGEGGTGLEDAYVESADRRMKFISYNNAH